MSLRQLRLTLAASERRQAECDARVAALLGCGPHSMTPATSRVGNRQPHLPNVERNRPRICRPEQPGSRIPRPPSTPSPQHQIYTLPCQTNFNRAVTAIVATNFEECCKTTVAVATMQTKRKQLQTTTLRTHETHPGRMVPRGHSANDRVMAATCGRAWLPQWAS